MLAYTVVAAWNLALLVAIARWRGITSYEGLGMALLALVVGSDYAGLCIALALTHGSPEVRAMVDLRLWPGLIHLLGLLCFALGLFVASPNPPKIRRVLTDDDARQLRYAGSFLLVLGLAMKVVALGSEGITSITDYFANIYAYNVAQRQLGTFWDWGTELAMFGGALLAAGYEHRRGRQALLAALMAAIAFFLTSSRAGIVGAALMFFVVVAAFNPHTLRSWVRPRLIAAFLVLLVVTSGIKTQLRFFPGSSSGVRTDWPELAAEALSTFGTRFGSAGVYAGYATMVERQSEDPSLLMHGRVLAYTLSAWVPHVVFPDKPVHPFRDIGYLVRENYSSRLDTVYAPTLVGYAWADFGLVSVVTYLFFGAFALGWLRRLVSAGSTPILAVIGYLHFTLVEGATNLIHNGFLSSLASAMLAIAAISLTTGYVAVRRTLDALARPVSEPATVAAGDA
ncbi:MAG TPA: hypothetical protein VMY76_16025 [Gemmatimonadales bacterium]|nr:hypothetical protein [Gemmatimonadales bacterium]